MFSKTQESALTAKLDGAHVKTRKQAGRELSYIEGWHAIAEANRIFGASEWDRETVMCECVWSGERSTSKGPKPAASYIARVRVTVRSEGGTTVREGTGAGSGFGSDAGEAHESAIKEAETDAMKRALMTFGNPFGLALYDKNQGDVDYTGGATNGGAFGGPLTKTELKTQARAFAADLAAVEDEGQLDALLEGSKAMLEQLARDLPDWWLGFEGHPGAKDRIEDKKEEVFTRAARAA